ncbi:MAG: asparagine synthase (glutamine-hydrolyzing) [Proteobacteria bacterium]|nr:asparagine synthase (glutamine-hydrolyzing) [Pseudomonadota bacterium]
MCGIAGFISRRTSDLEESCRLMAGALVHRGPDDSGYWADASCGVGLAHRRLSIVDLSPAGHQPMASLSGRYEIVFNGEVYNHLSLRRGLEETAGVLRWRGHSDTETLLAAIELLGIPAALARCVGMFALAVWDRELGVLTLARDRAGEKPLYYGRCGEAFLFGSELKALQAHPAFRAEVDRDCLALYLRHCYVPEPNSIFRGIKRLPPGTTLAIDESGHFEAPVPYWTARQAMERGHDAPFAGGDDTAIAELDGLLTEAVGLQMLADVPLGAFLSGGIDSSLIVALMQKQSARKVRTFTIGFSEPAYDESRYARAVAAHLGTDHTEMMVTPTQAREVIPLLASIYDEPFADSSQIPTFLVSRLARQHVTVALSGDGGDELFGGYNRYAWARRVWSLMSMRKSVRKLATRTIRALPARHWSRFFDRAAPLVPRRLRVSEMGDKLYKLADFMESSQSDLYLNLVSHWQTPNSLVLGGAESQTPLTALMAEPSDRSFQESMMYWDLMTYLPNDILVKVDRAAMAVSLETRVPMLDHRIIEFAWSLPMAMRVRAGEGKWILKQLLARYVPPALTDRPKTGFGIPINDWLRGPLRDWAEDLLGEARLRDEGFFNPGPIREKWRAHLQGQDWAYLLWDVLMFQAWWQQQRVAHGRPAALATLRAVGG